MKRIKVLNEAKFRDEISQLPEQYREIILLYTLEELSQKEVAVKLNLTYGVLRNRLTKGIYLWKKIKGASK